MTTPLLVPSFSSKGFGTLEVRRTVRGRERVRIVSELTQVLDFIGPSLTQSALFSAYDLYYGLLPRAFDHLDKPEVVFLDSGGYEASREYDEGQVLRPTYRHRRWSESHLRKLVGRLPRHLHLVIVSHDKRGSVQHQAASAAKFFDRYPQHVHNFLIKPRLTKDREVNVEHIIDSAQFLSRFDLIGVTEKELGNSLLNRLVAVNRLRCGLDSAGVSAPVHVFGSLDPMTVPLYFAAGAEVFDGLSWLRYYYHDGLTVYRDHAGVLSPNRGVQSRWDNVRAYAISENLACIRQLELDLRSFTMKNDCSVFGRRAHDIERGLQALASSLHGGS